MKTPFVYRQWIIDVFFGRVPRKCLSLPIEIYKLYLKKNILYIKTFCDIMSKSWSVNFDLQCCGQHTQSQFRRENTLIKHSKLFINKSKSIAKTGKCSKQTKKKEIKRKMRRCKSIITGNGPDINQFNAVVQQCNLVKTKHCSCQRYDANCIRVFMARSNFKNNCHVFSLRLLSQYVHISCSFFSFSYVSNSISMAMQT